MLTRINEPIGTVGYLGAVPPFPAWVAAWTRFQAFNAETFGPGVIRYDSNVNVTYHAEARNSLVRDMAGDWLLQLDTDHDFEPDLLWRMLHRMQRYQLDVLCGLYQQKSWPFLPTIYQWVDDGTREADARVRPIVRWAEDYPLLRIGSAGAGCLLVRRRVFDAIRTQLKEEPFAPIAPWSEDHSFFLRCRRLGIPVWCDTRIRYHHLRYVPVTEKDFDRDVCPIGKEHPYEIPEAVA